MPGPQAGDGGRGATGGASARPNDGRPTTQHVGRPGDVAQQSARVSVTEVATGRVALVWPIDARELVASGGYAYGECAAPPEPQATQTPPAEAAGAQSPAHHGLGLAHPLPDGSSDAGPAPDASDAAPSSPAPPVAPPASPATPPAPSRAGRRRRDA